jgi:hypothetical protein
MMNRRLSSARPANGTPRLTSRVAVAVAEAWADMRYANRRHVELTTGRDLGGRDSSIS